jgi:hypothetical protein
MPRKEALFGGPRIPRQRSPFVIFMTAEAYVDSAGDGEIRHITIGALGWASDEFRVVGCEK